MTKGIDTGAVLLAGGESRRMGAEKGLVEIGGKSMVAQVMDALMAMGLEILLVAHDPRYRQFGHRVVEDDVPGLGPVGGILSALRHSRYPRNLVLSCDVPRISPVLLDFLLERSAGRMVTIVSAQGRLHPLIGVYDGACIPHFEACLSSGERKLRNVIAGLLPLVVDLDREMPGYDPAWLENFNTMADVDQANARPKGMLVKVVYFGQLSDRIGLSSETLHLDSDGRNCDLRSLIVAQRPILADLAWKIAVDHSLVHGPCDVQENAEIVLLPPFAGG